jgi:PAS domain-containing protein
MNATPQAVVTDEQTDLNVLLWEADPLTLQFSYVSPAAERLLGYSLERWLSQPTFWEDLLHPDDRERVVTECRQAIADCRDHMLEYRMVAADGRVLWFRSATSFASSATATARSPSAASCSTSPIESTPIRRAAIASTTSGRSSSSRSTS